MTYEEVSEFFDKLMDKYDWLTELNHTTFWKEFDTFLTQHGWTRLDWIKMLEEKVDKFIEEKNAKK